MKQRYFATPEQVHEATLAFAYMRRRFPTNRVVWRQCGYKIGSGFVSYMKQNHQRLSLSMYNSIMRARDAIGSGAKEVLPVQDKEEQPAAAVSSTLGEVLSGNDGHGETEDMIQVPRSLIIQGLQEELMGRKFPTHALIAYL